MSLRHLWPLAVAGLAGCHTLEDVRQGPVVWEATYNARFDAMANCLSGFYASEFSVVPQLYQGEQRANVVIVVPPSYSVLAEFQIRQIDPTRVEVSWRHAAARAGSTASPHRTARERAERCARGG